VADEAPQHFVELRWMFAIGEVTRAIVDIHLRIGSAARDEIKQRIALVDARGGVLVRPREQGRLAEPSVADSAQGFVFLPCQMGEKPASN
jgi:hypothetical protein